MTFWVGEAALIAAASWFSMPLGGLTLLAEGEIEHTIVSDSLLLLSPTPLRNEIANDTNVQEIRRRNEANRSNEPDRKPTPAQ